MADIIDRFEMAERVERLVGDIYEIFSRRIVDHPETSDLFEQLRHEEIQHALRIGMLRKRYPSERADMGEIVLDSSPLSELLEELERVREETESNGQPIEAGEAMTRMIEFELRTGQCHASMMLSTEDTELREFFASLAEQDRAHSMLIEKGLIRLSRGDAVGK